MLKSGSEFREFSVLTVQKGHNTSRPEVKVQRCTITKAVHPDEAMNAIVEEHLDKVCTIEPPIVDTLKRGQPLNKGQVEISTSHSDMTTSRQGTKGTAPACPL